MQWKSVKGRDYLIHYFTNSATGKRRFDSHGPRSPKTEAWRENFLRRRAELDRAAERLQMQQLTASAIAKGLKIGRMPVAAGNIFRALWRSELRNDAVLTGSFSLLAYETQARASIPTELLSMPDQRIDLDFFLSDAHVLDAFERVLRSADSSFRRAGHGGRRFENKAGMIVDCFTRQDLAEIGQQIYGGREDVADAFLAAAISEAVDGLVVDRSGVIAPLRSLTLQNFLTLKAICATFDPMRSEDEAGRTRPENNRSGEGDCRAVAAGSLRPGRRRRSARGRLDPDGGRYSRM